MHRKVNAYGVCSSEWAKITSEWSNDMENDKKLPHDHGEGISEHLRENMEKTESFRTVADVFKLLADPSRVRIFWLLCHCSECVVNISFLTGMTSPAVSHHLKQLRAAGLIESRRDGKEVYYRAAATEQVRLLHGAMEKTMQIACPEEKSGDISSVPELPELDSGIGGEGKYSPQQLETIRQVHDLLTDNLDRRFTIEELSRRFLINPSSLKEMFKGVYGKSLAAHIKEHRMELAARLLSETDLSIAEIAERVGYESQSKFSAEFRKTYGRLPSEHRRNNCR